LLDKSGQVQQRFAYNAYGNMLTGAGLTAQSAALTDHLYSGEPMNAETGLQYLRARYYTPDTGRFNRLDPFIGNTQGPQSLHKYLYAHANPVTYADPSGRFVLGGLVAGSSTASGIRNTYNETMLTVFDTAMTTVSGVQAGMTANQIVATAIANELAGFGLGFAGGKAASLGGAVARSVGRYSDDASRLIRRGARSHELAGVNVRGRQLSATQMRELPGVAFGNTESLRHVSGRWLNNGAWGTVPKQVAEKMRGQKFDNFNQFRQSFWKEVAGDSELASRFGADELGLMRAGQAPIAPAAQQHGEQTRYILHHMHPIHRGGAVYDLDNMTCLKTMYQGL
jgi:RHS repeat-associated protein